MVSEHWTKGGEGARELAGRVVEMINHRKSQFRTPYDHDMKLWDKARHIARSIYGAEDIIADKKVRAQFAALDDGGYGHFPVCMAKTQYSFSIEPLLLGAPTGHHVPIGEVRPGGVKGGVASLEGIRAIEEQHVQVDIERQPR